MTFFSLQNAIIGILLFAIGGLAGWWLRRYLFHVLEQQSLRENDLPKARVIELEAELAEAGSQIADLEKRSAAKSAEIAKWAQRYTVTRKEIEERINIMDEVESENIELDSALCKSIGEQERLQSLLSQRDESLNVLTIDRMAQESRLLAVKEELEFARQRSRELESSALQQACLPNGLHAIARQAPEYEKQLPADTAAMNEEESAAAGRNSQLNPA